MQWSLGSLDVSDAGGDAHGHGKAITDHKHDVCRLNAAAGVPTSLCVRPDNWYPTAGPR